MNSQWTKTVQGLFNMNWSDVRMPPGGSLDKLDDLLNNVDKSTCDVTRGTQRTLEPSSLTSYVDKSTYDVTRGTLEPSSLSHSNLAQFSPHLDIT